MEKGNKKKLSICIPTYNRKKYFYLMTQDLLDQIRSEHLENEVNIKISDNGSTDGTWDEMSGFIEKYKDIDIEVSHFDQNKGADANFLKAFEMADGEYTILKGDDDYIKPGGLPYILSLLNNHSDVDYIISDYVVINPERQELFTITQLKDEDDLLLVNCDNKYELRNFFYQSSSIMSLGSFISAYIIKTEAYKNIQPLKEFLGTYYVHLFFIWNYLLSGGKKIMYTKTKYIEQCFDGKTNPEFGYGVKRINVDVNICVIMSNTIFKKTPFRKDILKIAQRMYPFPLYVNIDQRKDYKNILLPSFIAAEYPNIRYASMNSSMWHILYLILSLLPHSVDCKIRNLAKSHLHK